MKNFLLKKRWILFLAGKLSGRGKKKRVSSTGFLSALGIGFGVAALIVIISVMNGFQSGYIQSIMEISSFHVRAVNTDEDFSADSVDAAVESVIVPGVRTAVPLYEAQTLLVSATGRQRPALIRGMPENICETDASFAKEARLLSGRFNLEAENSAVIGSELARQLALKPGDTVNVFALSGGQETELFAQNRNLVVTGIFSSGYADINSTFVIVSLKTAAAMLGESAKPFIGIKLENPENDQNLIPVLSDRLPGWQLESWRSYNRSFFGALRIEKNVLMLLSFLIFVVVAVNIFNSMRRLVYENREEIAVLQALGSSKTDVQLIFVLQGLLTGIVGAFPGMLSGLLICVRFESVFTFFASFVEKSKLFFIKLINPDFYYFPSASIYYYYAKIPTKTVFSEVAAITMFGILSALSAAFFASRSMLKISVSEVLHDE